MKAMPRISDTEWEVMRIVWNWNPITANDVIEKLMAVDPTWHPKTVRTLLARLVGKRALEYEVKGRTYVYSPLVTEQDCVTTVSESFLDRVFGGSLKPMLAHFVEKRKLTRQDLEELEQLLDGYSNSTKKTMKLGGKHEHGRH
ncbi:MAG TPA: BlaI/MecI/CopY family transcriptional regulator [Verrucomicrobiae bacterium]|nr:BlaI/MecI/CopY family transcriptional regulator [Verrucomicrobiae bacterium]